MRAVRLHAYGGIENVTIDQITIPKPGPGEVLVRVKAASSNPCDWKLRSGWAKDILPLTLPTTLGGDLAGIVEAVGTGVGQFREGDEVFAMVGLTSAQAEYCVVRDTHLAHKPSNLDFVSAAAIPLAALTAWQALFDVGQVDAGQRVLIHAGAGGVGSFAIQFAKHAGATVVATASSRNHGYLRDLGANECIDYVNCDVFSVVRDADLAMDLLGGDVGIRSQQCLKPTGRVVAVAEPPPTSDDAKDKEILGVFVQPSGEQLRAIAALADAGKFHINIAKTFPLCEATAAHHFVEQGKTRGKVVITMD